MKPHESLHHLDIKDVGPEITESGPEIFFDPRRDILPSDLQHLREELDANRKDSQWVDWWNFVSTALALKELDPTFDIDKEITSNDREFIRMAFEHTLPITGQNRYDARRQISFYCMIKSLIPDFQSETQPADEFPLTARSTLEQFCAKPDGVVEHEVVIMIREIHGHTPAISLQPIITPERLSAMKAHLRTLGEFELTNCLGQEYAALACAIHELDPAFNLTAEITPKLNTKLVADLDVYRQSAAQSKWWSFARYARTLQTLSRYIQGTPAATPPKPLPEVRNY